MSLWALVQAPGQRKSLVWSERPVEAGKLSFCELGPGPHYSAPQTVEKPVPPPEERPVARPGALTSSHELPLQGVRISLMGFQITPEVRVMPLHRLSRPIATSQRVPNLRSCLCR